MKFISLSQNKNAIIDDEDFNKINCYKWYFHYGYAVRNSQMINYKRTKKILMHRLILNAQDNQMVDHIDRNPLNNQKSNLRFTNQSENQHNRGKNNNNKSGYKNISWHYNKKKKWGRWVVQFIIKGKYFHLGYFKTIDEARLALKTCQHI